MPGTPSVTGPQSESCPKEVNRSRKRPLSNLELGAEFSPRISPHALRTSSRISRAMPDG